MLKKTEVMCSPALSIYEKFLWLVFAGHPYTGKKVISLEKVAEEYGMSPETARRCVQSMIKKGFLERKRPLTYRFGYIYSIPEQYQLKTLK